MKKLLLTTTLILTLSNPVYAGGERVIAEVTGLVCDFCAQAIDKVFRKDVAVKDINVDLDAGAITIDLKEGQSLADKIIEKHVTDAGYTLIEIKREEKVSE